MIKSVEITLSKLRIFMFCVNVCACLFVMGIIHVTSNTICANFQATAFLSSVERIPVNPHASFFWTFFLCFLFFISYTVRHFFFKSNQRMLYATLFADFIINILVLFFTNFNYEGLTLLLLANVMYYVAGARKFPAMILGIFVYMALSYDMINVWYPLYSVRSYIAYYPRQYQHVLLFVFYAFSALNLICFTLFCMMIINDQKYTINEINSLNRKLEKANIELKEYADIKEKMGETKERNRLAMEIHDTIGHSLTGISVGVDTCLAIMDSNPKAAKSQLEVISGVAKNGIADIRRSVRKLQSDVSSTQSLEQNIMDMLEKTQKATGIKIFFDNNVVLKFESDEENAIFRVIQESVTNAIRHGKASEIRIKTFMELENLIIVIQDNGQGCKEFVSGFGTTHMKERLSMLKGTITFETEKDKGFTVKALIPLRKE
ncbi:MAG: sensor histidine kinase [Treponema sp.]|nr:sensor histidine kinase [Treponema sp.]